MIAVRDMPAPEKRSLLERLVFRGIVFNMSWEDPEMDRQAFNLTADDTVVSITSAGCNPLNLLCQRPRRLVCVDGNPTQNAVLELKLATILGADHAALSDIFAARRPQRVNEIYPGKLRPHLSPRARAFWDRNLRIAARGLYRYGRMGWFCRILRGYLRVIGIGSAVIDEFFECPTLQAQQEFYHRKIAPRLWRASSRMFVCFKPLMYLAGVHPEQFRLVDGRHDMYDYVKERIDHVMTRVPIGENYFLSQAISGRFRGSSVPPYLLEENFQTLRECLPRIEIVNGWLGPYLDSQPPGSFTKFNLLDIFDWMSPHAFEQTMHSVLRSAAPGATIIYRSGSYRLEPPQSVRARLVHDESLSRRLLATDRSGTYGSFYVLHCPLAGVA